MLAATNRSFYHPASVPRHWGVHYQDSRISSRVSNTTQECIARCASVDRYPVARPLVPPALSAAAHATTKQQSSKHCLPHTPLEIRKILHPLVSERPQPRPQPEWRVEGARSKQQGVQLAISAPPSAPAPRVMRAGLCKRGTGKNVNLKQNQALHNN